MPDVSELSARVTYIDGTQFVGESSDGHVIFLDSGTDDKGRNSGMRPTDLLLISLGSCAGMGIVALLKKMKQDVSGFEATVKGEKEDEWPKNFTSITVNFVIKGNKLSKELVKKAVDRTMDKYCTVKATLQCPAKISYKYKTAKGKKT